MSPICAEASPHGDQNGKFVSSGALLFALFSHRYCLRSPFPRNVNGHGIGLFRTDCQGSTGRRQKAKCAIRSWQVAKVYRCMNGTRNARCRHRENKACPGGDRDAPGRTKAWSVATRQTMSSPMHAASRCLHSKSAGACP